MIGGNSMWNLSFTACSFSMKKRYSSADFIDLNHRIIGNEKLGNREFECALDAIKYFFEINKMVVNIEDEQRLFSCNLLEEYCGENEKARYLYGKISSGRYGMEYSILDSNTSKEVYKQKMKDAPMMEFYVLVVIPKDNIKTTVQKGMLFFQNIGQYGVKTETTSYMRNYFNELFDFTMWSGNISPEAFLKAVLLRENIVKLHIIKNFVSSDKSDSMAGLGYGKEERTLTKLALSEGFISKIKGFLKGGCRVFEFENKEYDDIKVDVNLGGRMRKISLSNINNLSIIEGLPDDLRDQDSGKIDEERLKNILLKNAEEYMKSMVFTVISRGE